MDVDASLLRSRAEIAFAELLVRSPDPSPEDLDALCVHHPDLSADLRRMQAELAGLRSVFSSARTGPTDAPDLGEFECTRLLGRGGMGEVWEARDRELDRTVAIKVLPATSEADASAQLRFQREAQAAGRIQHPAIVAVHETGEWRGRRYIVQELVPGGRTLRDEIEELRRAGNLPHDHFRRTAERFVLLAEALGAAHAAGVIHRDIKPQNVLLTPQGEPKVADFGLAWLEGSEGLSRAGEFLGTYLYASPEQLERPGHAGEASDVFSLAATLYECLTLRRPFEGDTVAEIAHAVTTREPSPPHRVRRRCPIELSLLCMKALEKRPQARYASMQEFGADLTRFLEYRAISARPPSPWRRLQKWARRHPTAASVMTLLTLALAVVLGLYIQAEGLRAEANSRTLEARQESAVRQEVVEFLLGLFAEADPDLVGSEDPRARELLARGVAHIRSGAIVEPEVRARLLAAMATVHAKLGEFQEANTMAAEAVALWGQLGKLEHPEAVTARTLLGTTFLDRGDNAAAGRNLAPIVSRWRAAGDIPAATAVDALVGLASAWAGLDRIAEAERAFVEAEQVAATLAEDPPRHLYLAQDRHTRLLRGRDSSAAEQRLRSALAERAALRGSGSPFWLEPLMNLALVLQDQGEFEEADELYEEALLAIEASLGPEHPRALTVLNNMATSSAAQGRLAEAEECYRELLARRERLFGAEDEGAYVVRANLANCLIGAGRFDEALAILPRLRADLERAYGDADPRALSTRCSVAVTQAGLGRFEDAAGTLRDVLALLSPESPIRASVETALEEYEAAARAED